MQPRLLFCAEALQWIGLGRAAFKCGSDSNASAAEM
jgi:hypothetical protein